MKLVLVAMAVSVMLLCSRAVTAQGKLTADDVSFLRSCGVAQADIDVIPSLPADGQDGLQLVFESARKNCNMPPVKAFKATRDFLKRFTPPPTESPSPPAEYDPIYLTPAEVSHVTTVNRRILDKALEQLKRP